VATFLETKTRISTELRRANLLTEIGQAINDAIDEAAKNRFYFNEMHTSFPTVIGQEYYPDLGLVELDDVWYYLNGVVGGQKERLYLENQLDANDLRIGNAIGGQLQSISRYGGQLRIQPIPTSVQTIYLDGYGKLTPAPLTADGHTNAFLVDAERYIRALAKRILFQDIIRDYGEARVYATLAEDYRQQLEIDTTLKSTTDTIRSTEF
jgi:hypothetical protein